LLMLNQTEDTEVYSTTSGIFLKNNIIWAGLVYQCQFYIYYSKQCNVLCILVVSFG
jgi:hypothetical protein